MRRQAERGFAGIAFEDERAAAAGFDEWWAGLPRVEREAVRHHMDNLMARVPRLGAQGVRALLAVVYLEVRRQA